MKGISSAPDFQWFVQNRRATTHCRTYRAAEVAAQYSVGTDWLISWGLNFWGFFEFCMSACRTWKCKRQCVRQSKNAQSRRELVDLPALWKEISLREFLHDWFLLPKGRIFSGFQFNQFFPREITYMRSKYFLVTRAKNGWWYWKMQIFFSLEAHFLQGNQSLYTFFVRHFKHVFINRWEMQQSSCSAWTIIVFIMWW